MKRQILISVKNISNDTVHLKRCIDVDDSIVVPYSKIVDTLLFLYNGLNVKVVIEQANQY